MHPPPPSSIHLHLAPHSTIHLHPAHFNLHPALCNTLNNIWIKILHVNGPPNFGRKIKSWPLWLKIGTHGILKVLIPNPDLDFWNPDPKVHFWAYLGPKLRSCPFFVKLVHKASQGCWFQIQTKIFEISTPKPIFGQIWAQKFEVVRFVLKLVDIVSQGCWFQTQT